MGKPQTIAKNDDLMSVAQVAEWFGMSEVWVWKKIGSGAMKSVKLGRSRRIRRSDARDYFREHCDVSEG